MPKFKRRRGRKTYRKKAVGKGLKKAITKVVKKQLRASVELKQFKNDNQIINLFHGASKAYNFLSPIIQGTNEYNRIGNRIKLRSIIIKGVYDNQTAGLPTIDNSISLYMWLLQVPRVRDTFTVLGSAQAYNTSSGTDAIMFNLTYAGEDNNQLTVNKENGVKVLASKKLRLKTNITGSLMHKEYVFYHNFKGTNFEYIDSDVFQSKFNYYWVLRGYQPGGTYNVTSAGTMSVSTNIYFTDS